MKKNVILIAICCILSGFLSANALPLGRDDISKKTQNNFEKVSDPVIDKRDYIVFNGIEFSDNSSLRSLHEYIAKYLELTEQDSRDNSGTVYVYLKLRAEDKDDFKEYAILIGNEYAGNETNDNQLTSVKIEPTEYLVIKHTGDLSLLYDLYKHVIEKHMPNSGLSINREFMFCTFIPKQYVDSNDMEFELWLPVIRDEK